MGGSSEERERVVVGVKREERGVREEERGRRARKVERVAAESMLVV